MKKCHYDKQIEVYMYSYMCVDTETMAEEDYFPATKLLLKTIRKYQLRDQFQKIALYLVIYIQNIMSEV